MVDIDYIKALYKEKKYQEIKDLLKNEEENLNPELNYLLAMIANEEKEYDIAFILFSKAANHNHSEAERALGIYYYQGYGCKVDTIKGRYWVDKAIKDGNVRAYCTLAHIYMNGLGLDKDEHQGYLLYKKAAELGDSHAKEHLIECYEKGIGTPIDISKVKELKNQG